MNGVRKGEGSKSTRQPQPDWQWLNSRQSTQADRETRALDFGTEQQGSAKKIRVHKVKKRSRQHSADGAVERRVSLHTTLTDYK